MACKDDDSRYFSLDYDRTFNLISATDIEVPINNGFHKYFINQDSLKVFKDVYNKKIDEIVSFISNKDIRDRIKEKMCLAVLPDYDNDCLFIGFSPRKIIYALCNDPDLYINPNRFLDGEEIDIVYSNPLNYEYQKALIKNALEKSYKSFCQTRATLEYRMTEVKGSEYDLLYNDNRKVDKKLRLLAEILGNLDNIFNLINDYTISDFLKSSDCKVSFENLSYLISVISLTRYDDINTVRRENYIYYPYKFYEKCSKPTARGLRLPGVSTLCTKGKEYDDMFFKFNKELEDAVKYNPYIIDLLLNYRDNYKFTVYETVQPRNIMFNQEEFGEYIAYKANKGRSRVQPKTIDEQKESLTRERQFDSKVKFYSYGQDFSKHIVSRMYINALDGTGYVGFILDNDHIVIDKFFETRKSDDDNMVPAINSAVIAVPLDVYMNFSGDLKKLREYAIKNQGNNKHVLHKYHTTDSYQESILELANLESISSINAISFANMNGANIDPTSVQPKPKKLKNQKKPE